MVGPDSFTISQSEPFRLVPWRSYFAGAPTIKKLCVVNDDGSLGPAPPFIDYEVKSKAEELSCITDVALTNQEKVLEYKIEKREGESAVPGEHRLVIADDLCSGSLTNPIFTFTGECVFCLSVPPSLLSLQCTMAMHYTVQLATTDNYFSPLSLSFTCSLSLSLSLYVSKERGQIQSHKQSRQKKQNRK